MILRRLYLYLVSIAALAVLAFGLSALGQTLLVFALNSPDAQSNRTSLAGYSAAVVVAVAVGIYHFRVLRSDAAARPARIAPAPVLILPAEPTGLTPALEGDTGRHFELSVLGATEDDVHQALANLPPQASYKLRVK
ncbi:MAG: hypothetical protein AUJ02_03115 [Chloroflexi bacterium 13_1_40CM_3_65_12]|nr:MAG: hypothetical protein AUH40_07470 [Chloroflexi bacterium 13_1_40CM_65_17]OLD26156.1 MAG: hypothetical protein AUJ02_03115 [Chloroflexi bacterium 13_1_40CM_3_65_12]